MKAGVKVCLICYPYYPSKNTGRGHDRYIFELKQNIANAHSDINLHLLHQGFSNGVLAAGIKQFKLIADLLVTKADLYHAASPIGGATATFLSKSPLIVTIHDLVSFHVSGYDYSWKHCYIRLCTKISAERSEAIIVPHHATKNELVRRFNIAESKIHVVSYGVDHDSYNPQPNNEGITGKVLYVGEVSRSKGVDTLIKAFGIVKKSLSDVELLIGGKRSKDQPSLERLSRAMGLEGVTFLGYVPERKLPRYYSSVTVMVFPSRCGFGLSTLEAMACGTPVIVGASLDAPEFVADAGILFNPEDASELAESILRVLADRELREQLSAKAIERAKAFSWETMARDTLEVYNTTLSAKAER